MFNSRISLVIPVHNREKHLSQVIHSILVQTNPNFELIVWDDASTDHSLEIAQHYARHDQRVRVVSGCHRGQTRSLKAAFEMATGTYIGWVDSDDVLAPTALEKTVKQLDIQPEVGLVYTNYWVINEQNQIKELGQRCSIPYSKNRLLVDFMVFHFRLIRRTAFEQAGGIAVECDFVQDYDLCLRLSEITEIAHIPEPLYYYRVHTHSMSDEQSLDIVNGAKAAVNCALVRRGLSNHYELQVNLSEANGKFLSQFKILPKSQVSI